MKLAHVVNPVHVAPTSDLFVAQPVTFASMRAARAFAREETEVTLYAVAYAEDAPAMPAEFVHLPWLTRSVQDVGRFPSPRRLPLLVDILDALAAATTADYLIYTNVDIALQPHFYRAVVRLIAAGHDAFVINRRTISAAHAAVADLPLMWAEVGKPHPGWDCFVFRRSLYAHFDLGRVCLGAPRVGLAFIANLVALADNFAELKDAHLTFHLGNEQSWRDPARDAFAAHNTREAEAVLARLEARHGRFPRATAPGSYLLKKRLLGRMYLRWARYTRLPARWSRTLNAALQRLLRFRP